MRVAWRTRNCRSVKKPGKTVVDLHQRAFRRSRHSRGRGRNIACRAHCARSAARSGKCREACCTKLFTPAPGVNGLTSPDCRSTRQMRQFSSPPCSRKNTMCLSSCIQMIAGPRLRSVTAVTGRAVVDRLDRRDPKIEHAIDRREEGDPRAVPADAHDGSVGISKDQAARKQRRAVVSTGHGGFSLEVANLPKCSRQMCDFCGRPLIASWPTVPRFTEGLLADRRLIEEQCGSIASGDASNGAYQGRPRQGPRVQRRRRVFTNGSASTTTRKTRSGSRSTRSVRGWHRSRPRKPSTWCFAGAGSTPCAKGSTTRAICSATRRAAGKASGARSMSTTSPG